MTTGPRGEISGRQMNSPGFKALITATPVAKTARSEIKNELAAIPNTTLLRVTSIDAFIPNPPATPATMGQERGADLARSVLSPEPVGERLADKHDSCFQRNPPIQVFDVVVYQSDATRSDEMTNSFRRIRAVDKQAGLVQQQRACTQQTAGAAGRCKQRVGILHVRTRSFPVGPFKLAGNAEEAATLQALLRNADAVAARRIVRIDQIEKAVFPINHNRAGNDGSAVEHHLSLKRKRQALSRGAAIDTRL